MNRYNTGNIITNGTQILSVSAASARGLLGRGDKVLNNLSAKEKKDYYQYRADKIRDEVAQYNSEKALSREEKIAASDTKANKVRDEVAKYNSDKALTREEKVALSDKKADKAREYLYGSDDFQSVDDIMENSQSIIDSMPENSPQMEEIKIKAKRDNQFYTDRIKGRRVMSNKLKHDIRLELEELDELRNKNGRNN